MVRHGRVLLVRHALPLVDHTIPSRLWPLTEDGRIAAEQLASRLQLSTHEYVVASDELKARETADALSDRVRLDPRLGEVVRPWVADHYREKAESWLRGNHVEGWESVPSAVQRMDEAVSEAMEKGGGSACLVTHGLIMSAFIATTADMDAVRVWSQLDYPDVVSLDFDNREVWS